MLDLWKESEHASSEDKGVQELFDLSADTYSRRHWSDRKANVEVYLGIELVLEDTRAEVKQCREKSREITAKF